MALEHFESVTVIGEDYTIYSAPGECIYAFGKFEMVLLLEYDRY